jgi:hypothetical protein
MKKKCSVEYIILKRQLYLGARGIRARGLSGCVEGSWRD